MYLPFATISRLFLLVLNIIDDLLFWTDDYNPTRFINVNPIGNRYPNPVLDIETLNPEDID